MSGHLCVEGGSECHERLLAVEQIFSHISVVDLPGCFNYWDAQPASWALRFVNMRNPAKTPHATAD